MEDNFRNVLIILSGIVIGAIFIHGLWTIRKQKNPYKLKASKDKVEPLARNFDGKGFDQDGVGQVTVKKTTFQQQDDEAENLVESVSASLSTPSIETETEQKTHQVTSDEVAIEPTLADEVDAEINNDLDDSQNENWLDNDSPKNFSKDELGDDLTPVATREESTSNAQNVVSEPVYQQPVINAKPAINPSRQTIRPAISKSPTKAELKRNQMEINFGDALIEDEAMPSIIIDDSVEQENSAQHQQQKSIEPQRAPAKPNLEPQVIIISVVMPENQQMLGAALLPSLLTLGLKYGEMNIFHRHQDNAGNGDVTFSLANMMKPGSFELDSMETFATQGVSLFMTLPNAGDSFAVFEQMLSAAKQLAQEFNGQVLDDKRNAMTRQTEQHYASKIREFDRISRIASVE